MTAAVAVIALVNTRLGVSGGPGLKPVARRANSPEIQLPDQNGNSWRLSDHKGKVVLVNFWATWCPPCREEIPDLKRVAAEFRGPDFELVGIAMDESGHKVVKDFIAQAGIEYPVLLPSAEAIEQAAVDTLPTTYLVDKQGRVAKSFVGMVSRRQITQDIRALLEERN
jgi:peroxiredoxin